MKRLFVVVVASFALALAGQASALSLMTEKAEIALGKKLHERIMAEAGPYPDPELQEYVDSVGQELAKLSDRPHLDYHFTVLDDDVVNAFALPGGYIYITRGMLAHLNSEAELAAVIGHEIGHVAERHSVKRDAEQKLLGVGSLLAVLAAGSPMGRVAASEASGMIGGAMISGYSRGQELEADELGAKYMAKAGYSPQAITQTVSLLKKRELFEIERARAEDRKPRVPHGIYMTHPDNDKRFAEAVEAARQFVPDTLRPDNEEKYLDMIDGLPWGPAKAPGTVRNNYFFNARFGIKMKFPENWRVGGSPAQVQAISDENDAALEVYVVVPGRTMTAEDVIRKKFELPRLRDGKETTIAGMKAYIATADRYDSPFGPRPVRLAAILDNRVRRAYVFAGTGKRDLSKIASDGDFIATIFSFDRMKTTDRSLAQPPKVRVVRAEPGTTYESLAHRSAIATYAEQNLRLINGTYPRGEPTDGELIKTVD